MVIFISSTDCIQVETEASTYATDLEYRNSLFIYLFLL